MGVLMLILSLTREQIANVRARHITFQNGALTMIVVDRLDYGVIMRIVTSALGANDNDHRKHANPLGL